MSYDEDPNDILRFGDVLKGYYLANPKFDDAPYAVPSNATINLEFPSMCAVLTPCCSISDKVMTLTPLMQVSEKFFMNSFLREDLSRLNRQMEPRQSVPQGRWERMTPEEQIELSGRGPGFAFLECFIYEPHDLLPEYEFQTREREMIRTGYYMIDFRNTIKIESNQIQRNSTAFAQYKRLQLSIVTRSQLRDKISYFYSRLPQEDVVDT